MRPSLCLLTILAILACSSSARADKGPYEWAFVRMDYARKEKVEQLKRFCGKVHELAARLREDDAMGEFFDVNQKYFNMAQEGTSPAEFTKKITDLRTALTDHYIENYLCFYNILLVDKTGNVFYSTRKESDFHRNLFDGQRAQTPLAQCLRAAPQEETFVDFHYYAPSDKPAAFFVEPVHKDGQHLGWFVLQCAINKVNSLFAGAEQLGQTGEAFLVNHDGYMLTESNFEGDSTILKKRLDERNIKAKFHETQGHRTVTDYRGFTTLTSFEVVEYLGTQWLVVVKVDEAQIITEHFKQHRQYYGNSITRHLACVPPGGGAELFPMTDQKVILVDMDEFVRANHGELLQTVGVSTCTAVIASYPGKFGYLAHISPQDKIYGGRGTNLLGHVIKKIKTYDIYKYERRRVRFVVVATHLHSLTNIMDKLVDEGFLLSQISVLHRAQTSCANVTYDYSQDHISVVWLPDQEQAQAIILDVDDAHNIGAIVKRFVNKRTGNQEAQRGRWPATKGAWGLTIED